MRGWDVRSEVLFSYVNCERRVPKDHPLRAILRIVDEALARLSPEFEGLYAKFGRPSIPPERLLRALLLQAFYSVRSETQLMEQLEYNLLFRWFVGLSLDAAVWDATVFTKNRERLIEGDIARKFMAAVLNQGQVKALLSDDHFSVDGTLIEAWAAFQLLRFPDDGDRLIGVKVRLALVPCGLAQVKITGRPKPSAKPASQYAPSLPCVRSYGSLREKSAPSRSGERSALLPYYRPSAELGEEAGLTQPYSKFQRNISLFQIKSALRHRA